MSDADVREAARKQREREQAIAQRKQRDLDDQNDPRKRTKHQKAMVVDALAGTGGDRLAAVMMAIVLVVVVVGGVILFKSKWTPLILPVPMFVLMIATYAWTDRVLASRARAELARVRRGFEVGPYVEQLADNRRHAVVVFTLRFVPAIEKARRADVVDAVRGWMREPLTVEWSRDVLVARTPEQSCHLMITGGRSSGMSHEWSNRALHSQVAHFIRRVLPHLDNVAKLDVDIEGEQVAWNKEP
jgi:hypothetical protein